MNMKRVVLALMMVFTLSFATRAYAADNSTEFYVMDDLTVAGSGGVHGDADVEIAGYVDFTAATKIHFLDGNLHEGETLIATSDGSLTWSKGGGKLTALLTDTYLPVWQADSIRFINSAFKQNDAVLPTLVTLKTDVDMTLTKGDLTLSSGDLSVAAGNLGVVGNSNLDGTLVVTGATTLGVGNDDNLTVNGGALDINGSTLNLDLTAATSVNSTGVAVTNTGTVAVKSTQGVSVDATAGGISLYAAAGNVNLTAATGDATLAAGISSVVTEKNAATTIKANGFDVAMFRAKPNPNP